MGKRWVDFFSDDWKGYKVSYDEHLKQSSKVLFDLFEEYNLLTPSFSKNAAGLESYRRAYTGYWYTISHYPDVHNYIKDNFIDYLGIEDNCTQLKVEELKHIDNTSVDQHNKQSRINNIEASDDNNIPEGYGHYSALWHTDQSCPLNNMVMMIYVDDVEEGMGEFVISDPVITLPITEKIKSNEIGSKHLTGKAGTIIGFNSHVLHRGNIPKRGTRRCVHMNIVSPFENHMAFDYLN